MRPTVSASVPVGRSALAKATQQDSETAAADVRSRFRYLFDVWDKETFFCSFPHQIYSHSAYEELVSLGEPAIPYMLGELQRGVPKIVTALRAVSGESLVGGLGLTTEEVMAAWLAWGEAKGYDPAIA